MAGKNRRKNKSSKARIIVIAVVTAAIILAVAYLAKGNLSKLFPAKREGTTAPTRIIEADESGTFLNTTGPSDETESVMDTTEPEKMDKESAEKNFSDFLKLYNYWFRPVTVFHRYMDNPKIEFDGLAAYEVTDTGIEGKDDIMELFSQYCSDSVYGSFCNQCDYRTIGGKFYAVFEATGASDNEYVFEGITGQDGGPYTVTTTLCMRHEEPYALETVEWKYEPSENGRWLLTSKSVTKEYTSKNTYEIYRVYTNGSDLNRREFPSTNAAIIGTIPNGSAVDVIVWFDGWAYVEADSGFGWVSTDYLSANG